MTMYISNLNRIPQTDILKETFLINIMHLCQGYISKLTQRLVTKEGLWFSFWSRASFDARMLNPSNVPPFSLTYSVFYCPCQCAKRAYSEKPVGLFQKRRLRKTWTSGLYADVSNWQNLSMQHPFHIIPLILKLAFELNKAFTMF